jgi:hypothetical protein
MLLVTHTLERLFLFSQTKYFVFYLSYEKHETMQTGVLNAMPAGARRISIDVLRAFRPLVGKPRKSKLKRLALTEPEKVELARDIYIGEKSREVYRTTKTGRVLQLTPQIINGYSGARFRLCGKKKYIGEHQLRLLAWHGELLMKLAQEGVVKGDTEYCYPDDWFPDHIDRDPLNNDASNLRPVTANENLAHSLSNPARKTNAAALSRGVVIVGHRDGEVTGELSLKFPVGTEFTSTRDAARQTGLGCGNISRAAKHNNVTPGRYHTGGLVFEWCANEEPPPGPWCKSLGGGGFKVSSDGYIWFKIGNIKTKGTERPGSRYRTISIGRKRMYSHRVIWQYANGKLNADGEWIAADIPSGFVICHGGHGRALDAERIIGGYERNWPADLRADTRAANSADIKHEAAALLK